MSDTLAVVLDEVMSFRARQRDEGRLVTVLAGPLADAVHHWSVRPRSYCAHFRADWPVPLWAFMSTPGYRMCGLCLHVADAATPKPDRCQACGEAADLTAAVVPYDPFLTLLAWLCQQCTAQPRKDQP